MKTSPPRILTLLASTAAGVAAFLAGCASPPPPPVAAIPVPQRPVVIQPPPKPEPVPASVSRATNPRDYRLDAATHLYSKNSDRIYKGKMPPLLYAIGVLQVDVDSKGLVTGTHWMRAPSQAPEVVAEIERTVRMAEPYPAPARMGRVTYTDTWLWHKSGLFQLDTLTEGQL